MQPVVVTAWDPPSGDLVAGLLASLAAHASTRDLPVRVLVAHGDAATGLGAVTAVPLAEDEPVDIARSRLPEIVPGFGCYLWLDPATWVADGGALATLLAATGGDALAAVFEIDRAYRIYTSDRPPWHSQAMATGRAFGQDTARRQWLRPFVNRGVLALPAAAPHWAAWRAALAEADAAAPPVAPHTLAEVALNVALTRERLTVHALPATWNWLCHLERPRWDGTRLVEPEPPYAPIRILHLSGQARARVMYVDGPDGTRLASRLRFPLEMAAGGDDEPETD